MFFLFAALLSVNTGFLLLLVLSTFFAKLGVDFHWVMNASLYYMGAQLLATMLVLIKLNFLKPRILYFIWLLVLLVISVDGFKPFLMMHQWLLNCWSLVLLSTLVFSMKQFPYAVASRLMFSMLFYAIVLIMTWFKLHHYNWFPAVLLHHEFFKLYFSVSRYIELAATTTFFYSFVLLFLLNKREGHEKAQRI